MQCNLSEFNPLEVVFSEEIPNQLVLIVLTSPLSKESIDEFGFFCQATLISKVAGIGVLRVRESECPESRVSSFV
jgi:hypothetical protein